MKYFCARLKFCGVFGTESRKGNVWEQSIKRSWQPFHKVWPLYVGSAGSSGVQHYQSCYIFFCKTTAKWSIRWLMKFTAKPSLSPGNSQSQQGTSSIAPLQGWCKKLCGWHHSKLKLPQCLKRNYSSETNTLSFVCIAFTMLSLLLCFWGSECNNNWASKVQATVNLSRILPFSSCSSSEDMHILIFKTH